MLKVKNLSVTIGKKEILKNVNFSVNEKEWLMIVGPNGAGKSTAINAISQGIDYEGDIFFRDKNIKDFKDSERARKMGVLLQNHWITYPFSVEEVVNLGRYAYSSKLFEKKSEDDPKKVEEALELVGLKELRDRSVLTLSGGELQRTFLAQLFAQDPEILMLDEPTNHLDLVYQRQVFSLIQDWIQKTGQAVISVVHDLSLARKYGTHMALINQGKLIAFGECKEVLTRENLNIAYDMDVYQWMKELYENWE